MTGISLTQQIRKQLNLSRPMLRHCVYWQINVNLIPTDELIRDRIVCGIHSDRVRKHLLYESKLTLESAVTVCKSNEQ